jgi:hypothetical protein
VAGERVTHPAAVATLPVIHALLDEAGRKDYRSGVLGVRARPVWPAAAEFTHGSTLVRVVACESALAVREAITARDKSGWLVVLTDREDDDLGAGIRAHLVGNRLRTPDPWEAVRQRFAATGLDPALTSSPVHREIATGLLAAAPADGWPPAPAGVLTRDHALGTVARAHLSFTDPVADLTSVLSWTADPGLAERIADLRDLAGHPLTDAVLEWAAGRCGMVGGPVLHLLQAGEGRDCVPLGLVAGLVSQAGDSADAARSRIGREGLIRLEPRLGPAAPGPAALAAWAGESAAAIFDLLAGQHTRPRGEVLLARADELLGTARAEGIADDSDLLPAGLTRRLAGLADALRHSLAGSAAAPDEPRVRSRDLVAVEQAWGKVAAHRLAGPGDDRIAAFHAAVRLARYLAIAPAVRSSLAASAGQDLALLVGWYLEQDAWADSAFNDAARGVGDPDLGVGLGAVLSSVTARRSAYDAAFAAALARYTSADGTMTQPGLVHVEDLLPAAVFPVARHAPVLLLVLDGMSAANAAEIIASVLGRAAEGWAEALLPGADRRGGALAALPTLTEVSRAALLTGRLTGGGQDAEQRGYERLCREHGIASLPIFHKKPLDSSLPGHALPADVASAIADVTRWPLVTCVLNTIDDALDRADPGGTEWTAAAVRHLLPLLERARYAGRTVILTADHGHVVERRQGTQRSYSETSSGRSRSAAEPAAAGEILITGGRVVLHGGRAVLAVDERVRFGPLKAGYHGGATPAEAVVPVAVLVAGGVPEGTGLHLAPPQQPSWWADPATAGTTHPTPSQPREAGADRQARRRPVPDPRLRSAPGTVPTLFDLPGTDSEQAAEPPRGVRAAPGPDGGRDLAGAVVSSPVYAAQRRIAGRVSVSDDRVRDLLAALLAAPDGRLGPAQAAIALAVAPVALRGAILHAQRLLNIEGYPVLRVDADGATVIVDRPLLREQFGLGS